MDSPNYERMASTGDEDVVHVQPRKEQPPTQPPRRSLSVEQHQPNGYHADQTAPHGSPSHVTFHELDADETARLTPLPIAVGAATTHDSGLQFPVASDLPPPASNQHSPADLAASHSHAHAASSATIGYGSAQSTATAAVSSNSPVVLIAFINFHSGGKTGEKLAKDLVHVLGRDHVFDLKGDKGPRRGLQLYKGTPNLRVAIGGGDGTINWVLSVMRQEGMTDVPAGCLPLGTGNDASRAFGWGFKFPGLKGVHKNLQRMRECPPESFMRYDRWHAFAQYDSPPDSEWVGSLPASLHPIQREEDMPDFYRHANALSLPPVPSGALAAKVTPVDALPRPHQAASIDVDARNEAYNVRAIPLSARGTPHHEAIPLSPLVNEAALAQPPQTSDPDDHTRVHYPGSFFGSEWNNYLSWGVDAQVQASFHHKRESCRVCFCCRPVNMAWMGCIGAQVFCCCQAQDLDASVEVRDEQGNWVIVPLPPGIKSIVLLNTPTYAGGRFLWGKDNPKRPQPPREWECISQRQSQDDGLFEIVGLKSMWHLTMVMANISRGVRLAQVSEARLTFRTPTWAQADGEPYLDRPSTYHIRPLRPSTMMTRPDKVVRT